ncbi:MAG: 16S rRNA (guanine(966)-N(2))-methyltransferase RsmD [Thermoleophilia bacterium]
MKGGTPPGKIRIVAGTCRGRRLKVPRRGEVRPTSERVREAVFDVLGPIGGLRVLDLFAGSGALGLEALSRGAAGCTFVERDRDVARILRENVVLLGFLRESEVLVMPFRRAVERLQLRGQAFDLLFVDPPYTMLGEVEPALRPAVPALLAPGGVVVIEGPPTLEIDMGLEVVFRRRYGNTVVTMVKEGTGRR